MKPATLNLYRYFLVLLAILFWHSPLSAQATSEAGRFYLDFDGSTVFPHAPMVPLAAGNVGDGFKVGAGFTAAFGYAFKEGFSTEMEWGYQKADIDHPPQTVFPQGIPSRIGMGFSDPEDFLPPEFFPGIPVLVSGLLPSSITFKTDGEIKTQSLMGNVYYRYPKWRVSPYAGVGFGAFFHDRIVTSTITVENIGIGIDPNVRPSLDLFPLSGNLPSIFTGGTTTFTDEDSRFAYQIMGGLSAQISQHVEFHSGYRFRSSRGGPIDSDQIEGGLRFRF